MARLDEPHLCRGWACLVISLCSLLTTWLSAVGSEQAATRQDVLPTLEPGKTIDRQLSGGEAHAFQINLIPNQRLRVVVDQHGIDVAIKISTLDGLQIVEMDSLNNTQGPEIASVITAQGEGYRVEIRSPSKGVPPGHYELRAEIASVTTEQDRQWIAAQRFYSEGRRLRAQPNAEAQSQALRQFQEALSHWQAVGDKLMATHALYYLADGNLRLGKLQESLSYYGRARQLALESGEAREVATSDAFIANLHSFLGEPRKSLDYYDRALVQWRSLNDTYSETLTLLNLGAAYAMLGEARRALAVYDHALQYWQKLGNRLRIADALQNIGGGYEILGKWQNALEHYDRALMLYQAIGNQRGEAKSLNSLGFIYEQLGESRKALEYYGRSLSWWRKIGDRNEEAWTLMNLGYVYARINESQKALEYYRESLRLRQDGKDRYGEGHVLLGIGDLLAPSEPRQALDYYDRALPLLRAAEDRWREAIVLRGLGMTYISLGDLPRGESYLNQALELFRQVGNRSGEAQTLYGLARLERERGDFAAALRGIEPAIAVAESVRADVGSRQLRTSYFASAQKFYELKIDVLMRMHEAHPAEGFDALAVQTSEHARARSLLDLLVESRVDLRQGVDEALLERERGLTEQISAKATRQLQLNANSPQMAALKEEISALENEFEQVQAAIRKASPHYSSLVQPPPQTLEEIQQQLDDDTILLEYKLGEERSWLWVITNRMLKSYELPKRELIETVATQFHQRLTARSFAISGETPLQRRRRIAEADAALPQAARRLSALLLGPVAQLANKRLVIVPDGALHQIPFAALPERVKRRDGAPSMTPLIVNHEIVILPSASAIATHRRELEGRPIAPKLLAVLADPVFDLEDARTRRSESDATMEAQEPPSTGQAASRDIEHLPEDAAGDFARKLPRLPFTRQEADRILSLVPDSATFKATGFKASRATALNPELGHYRYLHFATHGLLDSERPGLSALVLSLVDESGLPQNGFLRVNDIYNLKLPAELVVLSACRTGLGKDVKGEGLIGLTRGFMYAGAARVVVSLWSVNDQATSELMVRFYQKILRENQSPTAALRGAQLEMWRQRQWRAPYYWATFVLQGEWR